jgi:hypothetical protein
MGLGFVRYGRRLRLEGMDAELRIWAMPLLRNVSLSVGGRDAERILPEFQRRLAGRLGLMPTQATPMALAFVLIATVMLVAPLGMVADRMPEMVRLITDLVH